MPSSEQDPERVQRCPASPGCVSDGEEVALGLYSPDLIDPDTNEITVEAIQLDKIRGPKHVDECGKSTGLSVARISKPTALRELKSVVVQLAARSRRDGKPRSAVGHSTVEVNYLRGNGLKVLDDGWEDFINHAVVRSELSRAQLRGIRKDLLERLNRTVCVW